MIKRNEFIEELNKFIDEDLKRYIALNIELENIIDDMTYDGAVMCKDEEYDKLNRKVDLLFDEIELYQDYIRLSDNDYYISLADYKMRKCFEKLDEEIEIVGARLYKDKLIGSDEYREIKRVEFEEAVKRGLYKCRNNEDDDDVIPF